MLRLTTACIAFTAMLIASQAAVAAQSNSVAGWQYFIPTDWQAALVPEGPEGKELNLAYLIPEPDNIEDLPPVRIRTALRVREVEESAVVNLAKLIVEIMENEDATVIDIGDRELRRQKDVRYKFVELELKGDHGVETHFFAYLDGDDSRTAMIHLKGIKELSKPNRSTFHRFFNDLRQAKTP